MKIKPKWYLYMSFMSLSATFLMSYLFFLDLETYSYWTLFVYVLIGGFNWFSYLDMMRIYQRLKNE